MLHMAHPVLLGARFLEKLAGVPRHPGHDPKRDPGGGGGVPVVDRPLVTPSPARRSRKEPWPGEGGGRGVRRGAQPEAPRPAVRTARDAAEPRGGLVVPAGSQAAPSKR